MESISYLIYGLLLLAIVILAIGGLVLLIVGLTKENKKNGLTISGAIVASVFGLLYLYLSPTGPSEVTDNIEGTYKFTYPTGQVEVLAISNGGTFTQHIYLNEGILASNSYPLHESSGTWTKSGKELTFDHWLSFCEFRDPNNILTEPEHTTMLNVSWYEANSEHKELISLYPETGYVFEKIRQ